MEPMATLQGSVFRQGGSVSGNQKPIYSLFLASESLYRPFGFPLGFRVSFFDTFFRLPKRKSESPHGAGFKV